MASSQLSIASTERFSVLSIGEEGDTSAAAAPPPSQKQMPDTKEKKQNNKNTDQNPKKSKKNKKDSTSTPKDNKPSKTQPTPPKPLAEWTPALEQNYNSLLSIGEECISESELRLLLQKSVTNETPFRLYDGFEPSGRMHIAQGVFKAMNVNKATSSGGHFVFWVADWFALMNDKMGGDLERIKTVGLYLIEVWRAAGMLRLDDAVHFLWASDEITNKAGTYWPLALDVGRRFNITRVKKCCQIMGRLEGNLTAAQILYPLMQCTDVFFLKADICQLGVDQRKVNMLAREYSDAAKTKKPVILSHHMLYGLKAGQEKMSKSDPDSAVFMEDEAEDVQRKIAQAYCPRVPEGQSGESSMSLVKDELKNPCLDYVKNIIFAPPGATFSTVNKTFERYEDVYEAFVGGSLSEEDLKTGLAAELNKLLEPVREHFRTNPTAKQLLSDVRRFKKEASLNPTPSGPLRRLNLVSHNVIPPNCHAVFLPPPTTNPTLNDVTAIVAAVSSAPVGVPVVLYASDWSARTRNDAGADTKGIAAYYNVMEAGVRVLLEEGRDVRVVLQSEAILKDPSNYWISVINAGRYFRLDDVMGEKMKDSDGVGIVIARLMRVADVLALSPSSIGFAVASDDSEDMTHEMSLVEKYLASISDKDADLPKCQFMKIDAPDLSLMKRENDAHKMEQDEYYLMDDPKVSGKSKMKKSFCEPSNISFNPAIAITNHFRPPNGITITRSPENGGDVTYTTRTDMERDFESGALHPGDLKAVAAKIAVEVLERLSGALKEGSLGKDVKCLKALEKKLKKASKK